LVILKLDFEKAFDKMEHEVILQVLGYKGFPQKMDHMGARYYEIWNFLSAAKWCA
jgi:hypothetical protein